MPSLALMPSLAHAPGPRLPVLLRGAGAPLTRADCVDGPRPCPWARCRHALPAGVCSLDLAEAESAPTLAEVGVLLGVSREQVRLDELRALRVLRSQLASGVVVQRQRRSARWSSGHLVRRVVYCWVDVGELAAALAQGAPSGLVWRSRLRLRAAPPVGDQALIVTLRIGSDWSRLAAGVYRAESATVCAESARGD